MIEVIYKISFPCGNSYIGRSKDLAARLVQHKNGHQIISNQLKFHKEDFVLDILEEVESDGFTYLKERQAITSQAPTLNREHNAGVVPLFCNRIRVPAMPPAESEK